MVVKSRRAKEKQERAECILDAAESVFFKKGFNHTTMDEIAQGAGLSRALLYVYFTDKSAIMRAIMLRAAEEVESRFERALHAGKNGLAQIDGIGHAYYAFSAEASDYFDVLTELNTFPMPDKVDEHMRRLDCSREEITSLMVKALENGLADGTVDSQRVRDTLQTAYYLQGALHGVIMQTRRRVSVIHQYPDSKALVLYTIGMLTESMRADS
jgi:AcrR family transcriptional regulator